MNRNIPIYTLADAERCNMPRSTLTADVPGWHYDMRGNRIATPVMIPAGAVLMNFLRDVAFTWHARYGSDPFPCDVLFPDGRFISMSADATSLLKATPEQPEMRWVTETQRWENV